MNYDSWYDIEIRLLLEIMINALRFLRKSVLNEYIQRSPQLSHFYFVISTLRQNIESRWHNILGCFNRRHGSDENPSYAVVDKTASGVVGIDMKENEIICKNGYVKYTSYHIYHLNN